MGPSRVMPLILDLFVKSRLIAVCHVSCGKTTLARLLAKRTDAAFKELSATDSGISDVRAVAEEAKGLLKLTGRSVIRYLLELMIDQRDPI